MNCIIMCKECNEDIPKVAAHGYSDGKGFTDVEDVAQKAFWDATKRGAGATTGYILAVQAEERVGVLKANAGIAAGVQTVVGILIKKAIPIDWANGGVDNIANGMITRAGVNVFRALGRGLANKWNIRGLRGIIEGMKPAMPEI